MANWLLESLTPIRSNLIQGISSVFPGILTLLLAAHPFPVRVESGGSAGRIWIPGADTLTNPGPTGRSGPGEWKYHESVSPDREQERSSRTNQ